MPSELRCIRILLIEEETLVRTALQTLIDSWEGFEVIGGAATKGEALELIEHGKPDVVLLSLNGRADSNLEVVRDLTAIDEQLRVLVLMGDCDQQSRIESVRLGARGVVLRNRAANELHRAIKKIYESDEIWLDRATQGNIIMQMRTFRPETARDRLLNLLTDRERTVVDLVVRGLKNKQVGDRLLISETTVRHHLTTVFNKLGISSRFELIAYLHGHRHNYGLRSANAVGRTDGD